MTDKEKIEAILHWAQDHPKFDPGYVANLREKLEEHGQLTYGQSLALDNIIHKFRVKI